jgi:spore coat protein JC
MWQYEKKLQYPVNIKNPNPKYAQIIVSQLGGPDGEIGASLRYLTQRIAMPYSQITGILTDVGTEELAHIEMVSAILYQLTRNLKPKEIEDSGFATYFVDHTTGIYPVAASGYPYSAAQFQSKGDILADLHEDLAAEQKARATYDNILRLVDDPDVCDAIKFLRAREIVHYQRFCEALGIAQDKMNSKNFYGYNPAFDNVGK